MKRILKHQFWHFVLLTAMLLGIWYISRKSLGVLEGQYLGITTQGWLILSIAVPVIHQLYVLICWRLELYYNALTKAFGKRGFPLFRIGFAILILLRPISILGLAIANANTFYLDPPVVWILTLLLLAPTIYLIYSVKNYFGFDRAFGIDHFYPDRYRQETLVRKGIFKYSPNAMYVFGFLLVWIPGILFQSKAALVAASFSHIYIWVHYFFTEKPDMQEIYG